MISLKKLRRFCPQPPNPMPSKLKRYSIPVATILTLTLILTALSYVSSSTLISHAAVYNQTQSTTYSSPSPTPPSTAISNTQLIIIGGLVAVIVVASIVILVITKKPKNNEQAHTPQNVTCPSS